MFWTKKQPKILNEAYPDWLTNGIFKQLENFNVAWKEYVDGSVLDLDYHGNRSGEKIVSAVIEKLLEDDILSAEKQEKLASLIFYKYNQNWTRAWEAMIKEYDPLYNYNMRREEITDETLKIDNERTIEKTIEDNGTLDLEKTGTENTILDETLKIDNERSIEKTVDDTGTINIANTGTESTNDSGTNNNTSTNQSSSNTSNSIYGFNSEDASNADKSNTTKTDQSTSRDTMSNQSTVTDDKNELTTKNLSINENEVNTEDNTQKKDSTSTITDNKRELTTKNFTTDDNTVDIEDNTHKKDSKLTVTQDGNIGVTTSQQMLESELQLRFNYNFFDLVFKDVDKVLTAQIFRKKETC